MMPSSAFWFSSSRNLGNPFELRRQGQHHGGRHGAAPALDRDPRPAVTGLEDAFKNGSFECRVVRHEQAIGIGSCLEDRSRHLIAREPELDRRVVDRISDARHIGRRVRGIARGARLDEIDAASCLDVDDDDHRTLLKARTKGREETLGAALAAIFLSAAFSRACGSIAATAQSASTQSEAAIEGTARSLIFSSGATA
jgi:hypothetical protein